MRLRRFCFKLQKTYYWRKPTKGGIVMNHHQKYLSSCLLAIATLLSAASFQAALAQTAPSLGSASTFAVLGGTAVTCTDATVIGDVGVVLSTGFTNTRCTITGNVHAGDSVAQRAYDDFLLAYDALKLEGCTQTLTGTLAGVTLTPGVYCFDAAAALTGTLTLNGPSNGIWIFKIGTLGTGALTGTSFSVVMAKGGVPCNVFWWVAQAATMTDSNFQGTMLAGADITVTRGTFNGDALAGGAGTTAVPTGAVTLTGPGATVVGCATLTGAAGCKDDDDDDHEGDCEDDNNGDHHDREGCEKNKHNR